MRNKEIAEALGLTKGTISALISRGMPTTNLQDIRLWREAHLKLRPKREKAQAAPAAPVRAASHTTSHLTAVERLQQQEEQLSDDIETCTIALQETEQSHQPASKIQSQLALLRKEHAAAVKALLQAQKQSLEISVRRGQLISAEVSQKYAASVLLPAVAAIRGMPGLGANEAEKARLAEISGMILEDMRQASAAAALMQ